MHSGQKSINQKKFEEACLKYHFDRRFKYKPISDVSYNVYGCALIDVDRTLTINESTLYGNWLNNLYRCPKIAKESSRIEACINEIENNPSNVKENFDKLFLGILKKIPLKENVCKEACLDAAIDTAPPPRTTDFILDLRDRKIKRGVITFSVEDVLKPWYQYRIGVPGTYLRGIKLIFRNGYLVNYEMPCNGKVAFAEDFVNSLKFNPDDVFAIDDDPILDKVLILMLGIGFVVWLDENKKRREQEVKGLYRYPGKVPYVFPDAKKNMQLLTPLVDKWRRARAVPNIKSPFEIIQINEEFKIMKETIERSKKERKEENVKKQIEIFISSCERLFDIGYPIISTVLSGIEDFFSDLKIGFYSGTETKNLVKQAETIYTFLYEENPESQLTSDYLNEIKSYVC
jgi:hypothetical protein